MTLGFGTFLVNLSEQQPFPNILKKRDVNGIIYWNHGFENLMNVVEEEKIPSVILNPQNESISLDSVSFDNYGTFTELFNYLHSKNYKKYFFLINEDSTDYSQKPLTAFFDFISTCDVFGQILAQNFPDAHELEACVFNSNEETVFIALSRFDTIKIIESFTKFNKTFPIDGGLVGNSILANFYVPKLTTVVNPLYESGLTVVNMIAEKWDSRVFCLKKHISLKGKILKNQSTKGE